MPGSFVVAIIFAIFAAIGFVVYFVMKSSKLPEERPIAGLIAIVFAGLSFIFLLVSMYNPVPTKDEGIETSFGATTGHLSNGFHLTWPWVKVHDMDAAIQTDSYVQGEKGCLSVRIANQQTGCLDISIRWRICTETTKATKDAPGCQADSSDELYRDYRTFEHVRDSLVTRELTAAANDAFANYNPLDSISLNTSANGKKNPLLSTLANEITDKMRKEIGTQIDVLNTIIPLVHYDDATQAKVNALQQQVANTRIEEQSIVTNQKAAKANAALAKSVNTSPNVLVAECMNTLEEMVKTQQPVPAGFSCWPGSGVAGVIANSTTAAAKATP